MKRLALLLACAATVTAAQTPATTTPTPAQKPATSATKPAAKPSTAAKSSTAAKPGTAVKSSAASAVKYPPGVKPSLKVMKTAFALKYQDIEVGTGPVAEPLKLYKVKYTGWLAADGKKFDSSEDHPGKEPIQFPQGRGRVIPGWDQGFEGMKIGGKRRIFIPWQLAYGAAGRPGPPGQPPVIPGKSDLVFDVELVDVTDMPAQGTPGGRPLPQRPTAPGAPTPPPAAAPGATPNPATPPPAGTPPAPATPPASTPPATTPQPATPQPATPQPPPADKPANPTTPQL